MQKFLTVLLLALTISYSNQFEFEHCFQNVGRFADEIELLEKQVKAHNITIHDFITQTFEIVTQFDESVKLCELNKFIPIIKVVNPAQCQENIEGVFSELKNIKTLWKEKKYIQILKELNPLIQAAEDSRKNCKLQKNQILKLRLESVLDLHPIDCLKEAFKFTKDIKTLENDISEKNVNATISETAVVLQELPKTVLDCGFTKIYNDISFLEKIDFLNCGQDLTVLYNLGQKLLQDYNNNNFVAIIQDAKEFYTEVQSLSQDCQKKPSVVALNLMQFKFVQGKFSFYCFPRTYELIKGAVEFVEVVKAKAGVDTIFAKLQEVLNRAQPVCDACGFDFKVPAVDVQTIEKCADDVIKGVEDLAELVSDLKHLDIPHVVQEVENVLVQIVSAVKDCKAI